MKTAPQAHALIWRGVLDLGEDAGGGVGACGRGVVRCTIGVFKPKSVMRER